MDQDKFQTHAEFTDEKFLSADIIKYTKLFSYYALILLLLTYICIWEVNYQKDSVFSTTTGKIEKNIQKPLPKEIKKPIPKPLPKKV